MPRKLESTPLRENRRRYEERNKEKRRQKSGNFQTMMPKAEFEEINTFLKEKNLSKVEFVRQAFEIIKSQYNN